MAGPVDGAIVAGIIDVVVSAYGSIARPFVSYEGDKTTGVILGVGLVFDFVPDVFGDLKVVALVSGKIYECGFPGEFEIGGDGVGAYGFFALAVQVAPEGFVFAARGDADERVGFCVELIGVVFYAHAIGAGLGGFDVFKAVYALVVRLEMKGFRQAFEATCVDVDFPVVLAGGVAPEVFGFDADPGGFTGGGFRGAQGDQGVGRAAENGEGGRGDFYVHPGATPVYCDAEFEHFFAEGLCGNARAAAGGVTQDEGDGIVFGEGFVEDIYGDGTAPGADVALFFKGRFECGWACGGNGRITRCGRVGKLRGLPVTYVSPGKFDDAAVVDAVFSGVIGDAPGACCAGFNWTGRVDFCPTKEFTGFCLGHTVAPFGRRLLGAL